MEVLFMSVENLKKYGKMRADDEKIRARARFKWRPGGTT
jgi:hypothetical protein